jgi:ORF6N domain-containing protein
MPAGEIMSSKKPEKHMATAPMEKIERSIHLVRGQKVILAADLAELYGVVAWRLNEQVKRNKDRFPADFMFQLTYPEVRALTSQIARSKPGRGGRRTLPYAFTEHGAIMAAMVLNSPRAVEMSVHVVRAFGRLRQMLATHKELAQKLAELELRLEGHDKAIHNLFETIRRLMNPPEPKPRRIGFRS